MKREFLEGEVRLIFARACAETIRDRAKDILFRDPLDRVNYSELVAQMHSIACVQMLDSFRPSTTPELCFPSGMTEAKKAAWLSNQAAYWSAMAEARREHEERLESAREGQRAALQEESRRSPSQQHQPSRPEESAGEALASS